jgi:DNA-binding MarR family transcriptional regulator
VSVKGRVRQREFASTAQEAMVSLLVAAGHVRVALAELCGQHGITPDQYNVLRILRGVYPAGHPRYEVAQRLIERAPDVTRLLDRLEREGLVERQRSDEDRRLSLSRITKAGLALLERMDPEVLALHDNFAAPLSRAERAELARLCSAIVPQLLP